MPLSSVSGKLAMALAGLFLLLFLGVHLGLNLLLLSADGGIAFTEAAAFMGRNPVIRIFEVVLFSAFLLHMAAGMYLSGKNRAARPEAYAVRNRSETSFMSTSMMQTGVVIFLFLALHFSDFYLVKVGLVAPPEGIGRHDFYAMALRLFSSPLTLSLYCIAFVALGFHVNHAFQSVVQTLGLNHWRYMGAVRFVGTTYAVLLSAGYILIALLIFLSTRTSLQ